eukprot:31318-Pelagococcus_subviridis.AAC.9
MERPKGGLGRGVDVHVHRGRRRGSHRGRDEERERREVREPLLRAQLRREERARRGRETRGALHDARRRRGGGAVLRLSGAFCHVHWSPYDRVRVVHAVPGGLFLACLSAHSSLSIPARDAFQLHLTPFNSTPTLDPQFAPDAPESCVPCACGAPRCRGSINVQVLDEDAVPRGRGRR